jgi:hypothetical protein
MAKHDLHCPSCDHRIGIVRTKLVGAAELIIELEGVTFESTKRRHIVVECACGRPLVFEGCSVSYAERDNEKEET